VTRYRDGVMSYCLLWLFCTYLLFLLDGQLGCWPRRGTPLRNAAAKEMGRASWCQVGLPAQSVPFRCFRLACMHAYVNVVHACIYMCMYVCVLTCIYVYICMCIYMCIRMHTYTCKYVRVCMCVHRLCVSVAILQRVWMVS